MPIRRTRKDLQKIVKDNRAEIKHILSLGLIGGRGLRARLQEEINVAQSMLKAMPKPRPAQPKTQEAAHRRMDALQKRINKNDARLMQSVQGRHGTGSKRRTPAERKLINSINKDYREYDKLFNKLPTLPSRQPARTSQREQYDEFDADTIGARYL